MITSNDMEPRISENSDWWALYTRHQHEKVVAEMLLAKGLDVFLPLYETQRRWKDRRKMLTLPLFPGYLFVRGGLERRLKIVTTPGVHMILSKGDQAAVILETEIQTIRRAVEGTYRIEPHPFLKCGERVRVKRGSLEGVEVSWCGRRILVVWSFRLTCWSAPWEWRLTLQT